jgi:hypothetical protein
MSAELIHRRRCECRRDVMRGLQTIVTCVRMGTRYARGRTSGTPRGIMSRSYALRRAAARPRCGDVVQRARGWSRGDLVVERCFSSQWFMLAAARAACKRPYGKYGAADPMRAVEGRDQRTFAINGRSQVGPEEEQTAAKLCSAATEGPVKPDLLQRRSARLLQATLLPLPGVCAATLLSF